MIFRVVLCHVDALYFCNSFQGMTTFASQRKLYVAILWTLQREIEISSPYVAYTQNSYHPAKFWQLHGRICFKISLLSFIIKPKMTKHFLKSQTSSSKNSLTRHYATKTDS